MQIVFEKHMSMKAERVLRTSNKFLFYLPFFIWFVVGIGLLYCIFCSIDEDISITANGILWNRETQEQQGHYTITIEGKRDRRVFQNDRFLGTIILEGDKTDAYNIHIEIFGDILYQHGYQFITGAYVHNSIIHTLSLWMTKDQAYVLMRYDDWEKNVEFAAPAGTVAEAEQVTVMMFRELLEK